MTSAALNICLLVVFFNFINVKVLAANESVFHDFRLKLFESFSNKTDHFMGDVLAIVHMNYPASLNQTQLYVDTWRPIFPHMVIFGTWNHAQLVELHMHNLPAIHAPECDSGFLAHNVFLKGVESFQHPLFRGYLYIHDDLIVSPRKLTTLDKNKFWSLRTTSDGMERRVLEPWSKRDWSWPWFNHEKYGIDTMQRILTQHPDIAHGLEQCYDYDKKETGSQHTWWYGSADMFYLPASEAHNFIYYIRIFSENHLFFEISMITYLKCFTKVAKEPSQVELLLLCTNWDRIRNQLLKWAGYCDPGTVVLHPVKFSMADNYEFSRKFLEKHNEFSGTVSDAESSVTAVVNN